MVLNEVVTRLKASDFKLTRPRLAIIKSVLESREHLTPGELYQRVKKAHPGVGRVTVYRTLEVLSKLGLVCEVRTSGDQRSYIACTGEHHDHLICSSCGMVVDFNKCNMKRLEKRLAAETGFVIGEHHLDFYGSCRACRVLDGES